MQLHACLLFFIITTDKTLALSNHHCGGNISLDQNPAGHINITLPGLYTDTNNNHTNNQPDKNLSLCAWLIDVPLGRAVNVTLVQLEGGSSISVRCLWTEENHDQVLKIGGTALLSGCDRNKATLSWTGSGHSSIQLSYYVQEDERNSSEDRTTHRAGRGLISQTGTSFTRTAPLSQEVVRRKEGGRGRLYEALVWSHGPQSVSGPSSQDQEPPHPTTPLQGLAVAGRADRETLPLPEEGPNNGADTSGTVHITDSPISAREGTHPYFHTRHTLSTDTSNTVNMETNSSNELAQTQMALTDATVTNSNTMLASDIDKYTVTHTYKRATTQAQSAASSFSTSPPTSSLPELPSRTTRKSGTILITYGGAVSEEEQLHSSFSTDTLNSDLTSAVTSDPFKSHTEPPQDDSSSAHTETEASASTSSSQGLSRAQSSTTHFTELHTAVSTVTAAALHPNTSRTDSFESTTSDVASQTAALESSDGFDSALKLRTPTSPTSPTQSQTDFLQSTESLTHSPYTSSAFTETSRTLGGVFHTPADTGTTAESHRLHPTHTLLHENPSTNSETPLPPLPSSTSIHASTPSYTLQTHTVFSDGSHTTHTPLPLTPSTIVPAAHTLLIDHKTMPVPIQTSTTKSTPSHTPHKLNRLQLPSSATHKQPLDYITTTDVSRLSLTTAKSDTEGNGETEAEKGDESRQWFPSSTTTHPPTAGPLPPFWPSPHPSQESHLTPTPSTPLWSSTTSQPPRFYIVPDQPAAIKEESIQLLLQIILEDSTPAAGLKEDIAAWVGPYLQKAPGFSRLLEVWSSGHAVQNLVEFKTSGALQWLSMTGSTSLLERTGLAQAVREAKRFRSSKITNITLGGQQGEVCDWLLQCPAGYKCVSKLGTANYSCSSLCHFDHCHHHGICTHHPGQLPVCRCLVGDDFWYMGHRCDVRMTRARLVGACLAILLIMVTVIAILAVVAVRRYRAILIQAKVDQTRSSYRRFNHFDELSGRFWLRSWAGSADSLDNPAFTRSDELLHLRALDRPCCYHDDTLSLASTCPSHGTRINTIYPHSSQYAWRGSEMSMGDGVLDSGKASDLSVCSWPVEPIQWTPFPLLRQLASHQSPKVRVSRPRSYCEGMELVDLEKSWTA